MFLFKWFSCFSNRFVTNLKIALISFLVQCYYFAQTVVSGSGATAIFVTLFINYLRFYKLCTRSMYKHIERCCYISRDKIYDTDKLISYPKTRSNSWNLLHRFTIHVFRLLHHQLLKIFLIGIQIFSTTDRLWRSLGPLPFVVVCRFMCVLFLTSVRLKKLVEISRYQWTICSIIVLICR